MKYSKLLSNVLMEGPTPGLQNPNTPDLSVHAPQEAKPADQLLPDVSTPNKPFELREAVMRKPSNRPIAKKIANPYPTVSRVLAESIPGDMLINIEKMSSKVLEELKKLQDYVNKAGSGWDSYKAHLHSALEAIQKFKKESPVRDADWKAERGYSATADLVEEKDNLHRLGIETEEEFGTKYKGQLEQKAEEHDLGDLLGYALLPTHIIIWGSENCMELTYDFEDPMVNKVYYFDVGIAQDEPAPIAEEPEDA